MSPLVTGNYYHIFNRGVEKRKIFINQRDYLRMITALNFYRFSQPLKKLSEFVRLSVDKQVELMEDMKQQPQLVEIVCYCLMPNHYHLLLKQLVDGGISTYLARVQNSYTRYFNVLNKRVGVLFGGKHKSVPVISDEQLTHLGTYIHLNPYASKLVDGTENLINYPWSSLPEYFEGKSAFCNMDPILGDFENSQDYINFVLEYKDEQRDRKEVEKLLID